jgi:hypothetical protein
MAGGSSSVGVFAIAENKIRVVFGNQVKYTGILDDGDASNVALFTVTPRDGVGIDGSAPTSVGVILSNAVSDNEWALDLTLDRPLTHWPARYNFASSSALGKLPSGHMSACTGIFYGLHDGRKALPEDSPTSAADISVSPPTNDASLFGAFVVDQSGDYATDQGIVNFKKRVWRRCITKKGGFAHLPEYGVGIPQALKRLATPSELQRLAASAEQQIIQEPETLQVKVQILSIGGGNFQMPILVRTRAWGGLKMSFGVSI